MGDSDKSDMVVVGTNGEVDGDGGVKTVNKRIIAQKVKEHLASIYLPQNKFFNVPVASFSDSRIQRVSFFFPAIFRSQAQ